MTKPFSGIYPALLTPFTKQNEINEAALTRLIEYNIKKGVSGFYVTGSTGEAFLLSFEERKQVMKLVKEVVGNRCKLIAQVGCIATHQAIELAKYAETLGYDAISSVAPYYYKFSFKEVKDYYFDIVNAVSLPMIIYNIPSFSGVNLSVDNLNEFLKDDRFIGVKHTSNDYFALERFTSAHPDKVFYNGFDEMMLAGLIMGADGAIGSTFNFMAEKFIKLQSLFSANKIAEAQALQTQINEIIAVLCEVGVMAGEKEVLNQLGFEFGDCRKPFKKLTDSEKLLITQKIMPFVEKE
ncbi:MAG: N-acetylneuraminate lyase [Clostridia bacterium]|nr:N-acetylneuraminate lyase [Clostridia bacterium]